MVVSPVTSNAVFSASFSDNIAAANWRDHEIAGAAATKADDERLRGADLGLNLITHVPDRHEVFLRHDGILNHDIHGLWINLGALQGFAPGCNRHI